MQMHQNSIIPQTSIMAKVIIKTLKNVYSFEQKSCLRNVKCRMNINVDTIRVSDLNIGASLKKSIPTDKTNH